MTNLLSNSASAVLLVHAGALFASMCITVTLHILNYDLIYCTYK